jgi:lysine-specific demethylase 8
MNSQATVPNPITSKRHLPLIAHHFDGHPLLNGIITASLAIERNDLEEANKRVAQLHSLTDGILNTGHYATVEDKYRLLYSFVCLLRAYLHLTQSDFKRALGACDEGLLKGNDLEDGTLAKLATFICQKHLAVPAPLLNISEPCKECPKALPNSQPIPCCHLPTMEKFFNEFFKANRPVVIRGMVAQWPAYRKWSFDFLNELCGHRIVPVELGLKYTDVEWNQVLMTFHEYLSQYVRTTERKARPGYLAQHRLADQVPELLSDIITPDYCAFAENGMAEDEQTVNVFIGPGGTLSPLHTDPRHNFFCQVINAISA